MPGSYFTAKYFWEHGERERAFALFNRTLGEHVGAEPFARPDYLMARPIPGAFESLVTDLLTGTFSNSARPFLQVPLGQVWTALWKLDRFDHWVDVLLSYDFFRAAETLGFDIEAFAPPEHEARDFDLLIEALTESARKGELSPNLRDRPNGGRPVLALSMIDAVDGARWGTLKPRLLVRLADAYSLSPEDPWKSRVEDNAEGVLIDFLHDLFGRYGSPNSSAQARWDVIRRDHPAYAGAARRAASRVLGRATSTYATELVRLDGGREVTDGRTWLGKLVEALNTGMFSALD